MFATRQLLSSTGNATGAAFSLGGRPSPVETTYQATITGTGSIGSTITVQVSNEPAIGTQNWITLGTITLSGTTSATDGFASSANWAYVRAVAASSSGTIATLVVTMAY